MPLTPAPRKSEDNVSVWSFEEQASSWCCLVSKKRAEPSPQSSPDSQRTYTPRTMRVPPSPSPARAPASAPLGQAL
jgi:hypothetical protein